MHLGCLIADARDDYLARGPYSHGMQEETWGVSVSGEGGEGRIGRDAGGSEALVVKTLNSQCSGGCCCSSEALQEGLSQEHSDAAPGEEGGEVEESRL